jgi:GAF domain-containing protein
MPPLFLLDITALGISTVVATSLALMALGSDWRRALNRLFALFMLLEAAGAVCSLLLRLALWFEVGNPLQLNELDTLAFILMGPILLIFSVRYVDRQTRWADLVAIAGLMLVIPLSIPLFGHQLVFNPQLTANGSTTTELGSLGLSLAPLPALYFAWSLILFWQERRRMGEPYLPLSVLALMIGFVLGGVLNVPFPILSITNTISVVILGYGVVSRQLFNPLRELTADLERRVEERTSELAEMTTWLGEANATLSRRSMQLEAATQVVREAAAIQDLDLLIKEAVRLVSNRFDFYHVGLFLLDKAGEYAVLKAASSVGGQVMLAQEYRLPMWEEQADQDLVSQVIARGKPSIVPATAAFDNPHLPDTRSQIVLPLRAQDEVIGALDIQSKEPQAFRDDDVTVLQTLADQLAMAVNNAQLLRRVQESLEAERRAYGELGRQAWLEFLRARPDIGFIKAQGVISPAGDLWRPAVERVLQTGEPTLGGDGEGNLVAPIKIHDQVIGVIDAYKPRDAGDWTPEQVDLLETLSDQLSVALDGARLHQDTQRRAAREQVIAEATARMRETLDVDAILQTAAREIGESLGLHDVTIQLEVDADRA